jgi:hypothetical protein
MTPSPIAAAFAIALFGAATGAAHASATIYAANSGSSSTTLFGGDRRLDALGFTGSASTFGDADFTRFTAGSLSNNAGTFGWSDPIGRDMSTAGNAFWANPDRADNATPFLTEPSSSGSLSEVFGSGLGYKNMSYLIDGEDNRDWSMDLLFAAGQFLSADGDATTAELAVLERGGNSDFNLYGIRADGSVTAALFVARGNGGMAGWTLNSLEIDSAQQVYGFGISLDASWTDLVGFRIEALNGFNGPDIIGVGTLATVPAPGAMALLGLAGWVGRGRPRRSHGSPR